METNSANIIQLIDQGIGTTLHWFPEDVPAGRLAATLVGMANVAGGTVLLGISPRGGRIQGINDPESVIDSVFQAALLAGIASCI
jgi:predicted HTH transcriptional regulator